MNNIPIITEQEFEQVLINSKHAIFSTETFYALGCDALNSKAVNKLFEIKKRPKNLAIPVIITNIEQLNKIVSSTSKIEEEVISSFWPGSVSILFKASKLVPKELMAGTGKIAIRLSPHAGLIKFNKHLNKVLASTSANFSGQKAPACLKEINSDLFKSVEGVCELYPSPKGFEASTLIDCSSDRIKILRHGVVKEEDFLRMNLPIA